MLIPVESFDDPRVGDYRNLKDRELAAEGDRFIAEGKFITQRLLDSDYPVESVFLAQRRVAEIAPQVPETVPIYVVPEAVVHQVVGYKFHSGILAIGRRKPSFSVDEMMQAVVGGGSADAVENRPLTLMVLPATRNAENLGALFRIGAAMGVAAVVLGPECTDPWWRRVVRVSMGTVFRLPIVCSDDLVRDLKRLGDPWQVQRLATVTDADAAPLPTVSRPLSNRVAVLFGPEDHGLDRRWVDLCDRRVTIPMHLGTDSLNVAVAAAVVLYELGKHCG